MRQYLSHRDGEGLDVEETRQRFDFDPKAAVYALAPDRQRGGVWLAVTAPNPLPQHGARILKFEEGKLVQELQPYPWLQDSQRTRVTTMLQDRRGRLWVGTWVNGVFCWGGRARLAPTGGGPAAVMASGGRAGGG